MWNRDLEIFPSDPVDPAAAPAACREHRPGCGREVDDFDGARTVAVVSAQIMTASVTENPDADPQRTALDLFRRLPLHTGRRDSRMVPQIVGEAKRSAAASYRFGTNGTDQIRRCARGGNLHAVRIFEVF